MSRGRCRDDVDRFPIFVRCVIALGSPPSYVSSDFFVTFSLKTPLSHRWRPARGAAGHHATNISLLACICRTPRGVLFSQKRSFRQTLETVPACGSSGRSRTPTDLRKPCRSYFGGRSSVRLKPVQAKRCDRSTSRSTLLFSARRRTSLTELSTTSS